MASFSDFIVEDSTDWLGTPLAKFTQVEAALRCQVCKEFYNTPMITQCSHTFCSKCIRRCLSNDAKCPACRAGSQESQLRSNWGMEELVNTFKLARGPALEFARRILEEPVSKKRKLEVGTVDAMQDISVGKRATRSSSRNTPLLSATKTTELEDEQLAWSEDARDDDYQPDDGLVACPMCDKRMKMTAVDPHLDRCTGPPSPSGLPSRQQEDNPGSSLSARTLSKPQNGLIPLASINYHTLNESKLRKKLSELGIPGYGTKQQMEQRHKEWTTIWNANCDAARPRKKTDLLKDLSSWEKSQGARAVSGNPSQISDIRSKEFDRESYAAKQKDQFSGLIASARQKLARPRQWVGENSENGLVSTPIDSAAITCGNEATSTAKLSTNMVDEFSSEMEPATISGVEMAAD